MRGDHVYVERRPLGNRVKVRYTHHGIDLGDGKVVHYSGEPGSPEPGRVVVSTVEEFLKGGKLRVRRYKDAFPREKSARMALARLGEANYHLVSNNCEHFAHWCRTGIPWSKQVVKAALHVAAALGSGPAKIAAVAIKAWSRGRSR